MLNQREFEELDQKYNISKHMHNQRRFCMIARGRNNTQDRRIYRNLKALFSQNYTNFHVVYVDDDSDDGTMT